MITNAMLVATSSVFLEDVSSEDARGGRKKKGGGKTSRRTPVPKKVLDHSSSGMFSTSLGCQCSVFLFKNPRLSRPEARLEGSRNFREGELSGTFSSPHTFCHIMAHMLGTVSARRIVPPTPWRKRKVSYIQSAPKEQRRRRAEKRSSKRVFLECPFLNKVGP